jgi:hypothetical protein
MSGRSMTATRVFQRPDSYKGIGRTRAPSIFKVRFIRASEERKQEAFPRLEWHPLPIETGAELAISYVLMPSRE